MNKIEAARILAREIEAKMVSFDAILKEAIGDDDCDERTLQYLILAQSETTGLGVCVEMAAHHLLRAEKTDLQARKDRAVAEAVASVPREPQDLQETVS